MLQLASSKMEITLTIILQSEWEDILIIVCEILRLHNGRYHRKNYEAANNFIFEAGFIGMSNK